MTARAVLFLPLFFLVLAGCATTVGEDQVSWFGATPEEVRAAWGAPAKTEKLADGAEVQTWINESPSVYGSGASVGVGVGIFRGGGSIGVGTGVGASVPVGGGVAEPIRCERRLTFRDGRVFDAEFLGGPRACSGYQNPAKPR